MSRELVDRRRAINLADQLGESARAVEHLCLAERAAVIAGRLEEALAFAQDGLARSRAAGDRASEVRSLTALCDAYFYLPNYPLSIQYGHTVVACGRELGDPSLLSMALQRLAWTLAATGRIEEARPLLTEAVEQARKGGDREVQGSSFNTSAYAYRDLGAQIWYYRQALELNTAAGLERAIAIVQINLAYTYDQLGLYPRGRKAGEEALAYFQALHTQSGQGIALINLGHAYIGLGDLAKARFAWQRAYVLSEHDRANMLLGAMLLGRLALHRDEAEAANNLLAPLDADFQDVGLPDLASLYALRAQAHLLLGQTQEAEELTAAAIYGRDQNPGANLELPAQEICWARYQVLSALGRAEEAWEALERARGEMLQSVESMADAGLRRNVLNKVPINRLIVPIWLEEATRRGRPLELLDGTAGGSAGAQAETGKRAAGERGVAGQLERMLEIGVRLNSRDEAEDLPSLIMDELVELTGAERAALYLFTEAGARQVAVEVTPVPLPRYMCLHAPASALTDESVPAEQREALLGEVAEKRAPLLRYFPAHVSGQDALRQHSVLCVPLVSRSKLLGLIYAELRGVFGRFSPDDLNLVSVLANQAAVAVENAAWASTLERRVEERTAELKTAYDSLEQRANELAIINSVGQGLAKQLDFQSIIDLVGDKVRDVFGGQDTSIRLYDEATDRMSFAYLFEAGERIQTLEPVTLSDFPGFSRHIVQSRSPLVVNRDMEARMRESGKLRTDQHSLEPVIPWRAHLRRRCRYRAHHDRESAGGRVPGVKRQPAHDPCVQPWRGTPERAPVRGNAAAAGADRAAGGRAGGNQQRPDRARLQAGDAGDH